MPSTRRSHLSALISDYSLIFIVGSDPNPKDVFAVLDSKGVMITGITDGLELPDLLEMKRWMAGSDWRS